MVRGARAPSTPMVVMYLGFIGLVIGLLALDLGVLNRKAHVVSTREALKWSAFWISLGLSFTALIYFGYEQHWLGLGYTRDTMSTPVTDANGVLVYNDGASAAIKYVTGFFVEKSLAVDNIFVIAMIFSFFGVPALYQHRVLFWGIFGALVLRGTMIGVGAELLTHFSWVIYIFGGFLVLTGLKMLFLKQGETDLEKNPLVKLTRRLLPVTQRYHGEHFFVRAGSEAAHEARTPGEAPEHDNVVAQARPSALLVTPLFLALMCVEFTDVVFAVDSIPAIFAITTDAFLVFTSNVFAMLGLRSLYFALAGMMDSFRYLGLALGLVLIVVGTKMMAHSWLKSLLGEHFNLYLLALILCILAVGIVASLMVKPPAETSPET
jgi:tellurite resistance protein TerC